MIGSRGLESAGFGEDEKADNGRGEDEAEAPNPARCQRDSQVFPSVIRQCFVEVGHDAFPYEATRVDSLKIYYTIKLLF